MNIRDGATDLAALSSISASDAAVLSELDERALLEELTDCKRKLAAALASVSGIDPSSAAPSRPLGHMIARAYEGDCRNEARLGAVDRRYSELRDQLAMANMRLVAHIAKRFRDRGISYGDLIQEGVCGLLEAIDRFDVTHRTKLATYATWWIRQSMQRAVASGGYPVRLTPRHLRRLAQSQLRLEQLHGAANAEAEPSKSDEMINCIQLATRTTLSLDACFDDDTNFSLMSTLSDADRTGEFDSDDGVKKLMDGLRPRERQVLCLRFGLEGGERLSLSEVGKVLAVSKERVRQIQDAALKKLRDLVKRENLIERLSLEL
jgi:RNA polymerase primary sigma factor